PGRTLSQMPSEQKGAYGGHLGLSDVRHGENDPNQTACVAARIGPSRRPVRASLHRTTEGPASDQPYRGTSGSGSGSLSPSSWVLRQRITETTAKTTVAPARTTVARASSRVAFAVFRISSR